MSWYFSPSALQLHPSLASLPVQFSVYLLPLLFAAVVSLSLSYFAVKNRDKRTAKQVTGILLGAGIWAAADAMRLAVTPESMKLFWHNVRFAGSTLLVLAVILFALEYTNHERWLTRRVVAGLAAPFVLTVILVWTNDYHQLVRSSVDIVEARGIVLADIEHGPWFVVNALYSYVLLLVVLGLFVLEYVRKSADTYRRQTLLLILSLLVPWGLNAIYLADVTVVDLTPVGLVVTGVIFYASLFRFELLDLVPIARSTVVDHIEHGVLVLDTEDRIVDVNHRAAEMIGLPRSRIIGLRFDQLHGDLPEIVEKVREKRTVRDAHSMETDGERRHYTVDISPLYSRIDRFLGRVVLIRDVTHRRRREAVLRERTERLEEQNETLDQFASIVSHDLRNPINVAKGYLELARETGDPDHFDEVERSLDRMHEIVEDVLTLTRQPDTVRETEPVEVATVASQAWGSIDASDGTLIVEATRTVEADPGRVRQLFENLIRNSFDHGPADATVTVGDLEGGFYLEDDGPGIPEDERETVLEEGYTTREEGTGLGLSIVAKIASAHGWSIDVAESTDGGARFEITGVTESVSNPPTDASREP